jgi:hypothetical protein
MNPDYPTLYGAMRGTLTSVAYFYDIPGVEIKDAAAFSKWLDKRANDSDEFARKMSLEINKKSS